MSRTGTERELADRAVMEAAIGRLADEIAAALGGAGPVFLAGIPTRGVSLAARLATRLERHGVACRRGAVDISMYRDDLGLREGVSALQGTDLPMDIDHWDVILVDDVQHTGRTARAAIEPLKARGAGRIIVVGSGSRTAAHAGMSAYAGSKLAAWMLVRVLAVELEAYRISVNELIPGPVKTAMTRFGEMPFPPGEWVKEPEDVVPMAMFLATQPDVGPTAQSFSLMRRA